MKSSQMSQVASAIFSFCPNNPKNFREKLFKPEEVKKEG
jgi:hypothetical protein